MSVCTGNCKIGGGGSSPASWGASCSTCGKTWGPSNPKDDRPKDVKNKRAREANKKGRGKSKWY